ncbi:MAG: hypothetical protein ACTSW1_07675 [Candidatus Hodarchaeales archaeon]
MNKSPCFECFCNPLCKHRRFAKTLSRCSLVRDYLYTEKCKEYYGMYSKQDFVVGHGWFKYRLDYCERLNNLSNQLKPIYGLDGFDIERQE